VPRAPGISLRPLISLGERFFNDSGGARRGIAQLYSQVVVRHGLAERTPDDRLGRTIQYSRDVADGTEKPQRTGRPASTGYDSTGGAAPSPHRQFEQNRRWRRWLIAS
jgi:hypothetical protein